MTISGQADEKWMREALAEAQLALAHADVPIGAVAVYEGQIIGRGHNERELTNDPSAHAEIIAIRQAGHYLKSWRLDDVTLYCTLEPCCMCAGAMVQARLSRLVYGAIEPKTGCAGSVMDVLRNPKFNHRVDIDVGLLADESNALLQSFFQNLR
jgi:tRNA(adenine34) deaminase